MNRQLTLALLSATAIVIATTSYAQEPSFGGAKPLNLPRSFMTNDMPLEPSDPQLHATWAKIPNMKQIVPKLERHEGVFHGPHKAAPASASGYGGFASSLNWSGSVANGSNNQYGTSTTAMSVVVPSHEQAFGNCNHDGTTYTATWVGVDGWGSSTVEQAGLWIGVTNCDQPGMSAFIETYPNPEINVTNFPIAPGNVITVFSTTNQATRTECAMWVNESQNVATNNTCLVAPAPFSARSVEWVVERPTYGSQYVDLANYVAFPIWNAWAWSSADGHTLAAGAESPCYIAGAPCAEFNYVAMMDNNWKMISYPLGSAPSVLFMRDTGSAFCAAGPCVPEY